MMFSFVRADAHLFLVSLCLAFGPSLALSCETVLKTQTQKFATKAELLVRAAAVQGIVARPTSQGLNDFACEVTKAFDNLKPSWDGGREYGDRHMFKRPVYILRALRHLGIQDVQETGMPGFKLKWLLENLVQLIQTSGFDEAKAMDVRKIAFFGLGDLIEFVRVTRFRQIQDGFRIDIETNCEEKCVRKVPKISFAVKGLKATAVTASSVVTLTFVDDPTEIARQVQKDKAQVSQRYNWAKDFLPAIHQRYLTGEEWPYRWTFATPPILVKVAGLKVTGSYFGVPGSVELTTLAVLPMLFVSPSGAASFLSSPAIFSMDAKLGPVPIKILTPDMTY